MKKAKTNHSNYHVPIEETPNPQLQSSSWRKLSKKAALLSYLKEGKEPDFLPPNYLPEPIPFTITIRARSLYLALRILTSTPYASIVKRTISDTDIKSTIPSDKISKTFTFTATESNTL